VRNILILKEFNFFSMCGQIRTLGVLYWPPITMQRRPKMKQFIITEDFPMNELEFDKRFCNEQSCYDYLFQNRWPDGFLCTQCGNTDYWLSNRQLFICTNCQFNHSLTAGTIFNGTRKKLTLWFKAMWWFTTRKAGINALTLKALLGLGSYKTAWAWLHKLRSCTIRDQREKLSGTVEVDEVYIGGRHSGKRGRGSENKLAVVVATEKNGKKLGRIRLQVIENCSGNELIPFIQANIASGSSIVTDGWKGYNGLDEKEYKHHQVYQKKAEKKESVLPGVHMVAALIKRVVLGTYHGRLEGKYLQRYLDEYTFRFNRRNTIHVGKRFYRIVQQTVNTMPFKGKNLILCNTRPLVVA
jgi:transposase-like protein